MISPVTPISSGQMLVFLLQAGLLLLLASALGYAARQAGMPAIAGELCAGVLLGPSVLGTAFPQVSRWLLPRTAGQFHLLDAVGQFGVVLLVAVIGSELDLGVVRRRGPLAVRISLAGFLVPLGLGVAVGLLWPVSLLAGSANRVVFALFLGVALCVTAIPVLAKTLMDMNLLHRNIGQLAMAAGAADDVLGWLMLSVVSAMATGGLRAGHIALSLLAIAGVIGVAALIGRPAVRAAMSFASGLSGSGPSIAVAVSLVLLGAAATQALGLEAVFGALVVGILLGTCDGAAATLAPLRVVVQWVLAPLFFATAGLRMDLTVLARPTVLAAAVVVLLAAVVGKFASVYAAATTSGLSRWETLAVAAGMNARGVIQMIVAMVGLRLGILGAGAYTIVMLVALATSLMAPPVLGLAMNHVERTAEEELRHQVHAAALGVMGEDNR